MLRAEYRAEVVADRLVGVGDAASHGYVVAALGLAQDHMRVLVGDHDLARAPIDRDPLAFVAGEVGMDPFQGQSHADILASRTDIAPQPRVA